MKILALETSTETASVALLDGDRLHERSVAGRPGHSETILPEIRRLLDEGYRGCASFEPFAEVIAAATDIEARLRASMDYLRQAVDAAAPVAA